MPVLSSLYKILHIFFVRYGPVALYCLAAGILCLKHHFHLKAVFAEKNIASHLLSTCLFLFFFSYWHRIILWQRKGHYLFWHCMLYYLVFMGTRSKKMP